jgi:ribosome-binding factor A
VKSRHSKRGFDRTQRVADLIQRTLAQMLLRDMSDERFHLVTVTSVEVARDMSHAKVYVSVLMDDEIKIKNTVAALNRAVKSLRYQLAKEVKLRIVPDLKFVYDAATAHGFHVSTLIDAAMKKTEK